MFLSDGTYLVVADSFRPPFRDQREAAACESYLDDAGVKSGSGKTTMASGRALDRAAKAPSKSATRRTSTDRYSIVKFFPSL